MNTHDVEFPFWALLPKKETGVNSFLSKYQDYDGRGVIIGILDSGIDPGAPGLQVTSDGKPKIIGRYDCSGAGDVDVSTVVQATNGEIIGLSGRKLKIPPAWKNPSGNFHIGLKNSYELYPKLLKERIEKERREKKWDPGFKPALAEVTLKLNELAKDDEEKNQSLEQKLSRENLESYVEVLTCMDKKYSDLGQVYDCVVYHDGDVWCCCIDTSESGELESCSVVQEYCKSLQFASLAKNDFLNYSINVHSDGNLLEIVSVCSAHGTHVASIAAACFPDDPVRNGIAPGAQIISLTIGDSRIETMETGTAIVRAIIKVMESRSTSKPIDVINMSYGEHSHWSSSGRIGSLMNEVVDKYGVTWVTAAGNHGPALCTIGTPPDISSNNIVGVGAYVSPEMMVAEYSLRQKAPGLPYTWSSRGPTIDGGRGVSICAPGGAITSVPQYMLRHAQLLNGTSMASPHVAGAIALLISGMRAKNLPCTPHSIRRALENTALYLKSMDHFGQGYGLLQVEKAFDHLQAFAKCPESKMRFHVACGAGKHKGIHLRHGPQNKPRDVSVTIEPIFGDSDEAIKEKMSFEMAVSLVCDQPWVSHPSYIQFTNISRTIQVRIDPSGLAAGAHSASIDAFDILNTDKGPVFRVDITVIKPVLPLELNPNATLSFSNVNIKSGQIIRHFVLVPDRATYAVVRVQVLDESKQGIFVFHALGLRPRKSCKALEYNKMFNVGPNSETLAAFRVKGGLVHELVIAKLWLEQSDSNIDYSLNFFGCRPDGESFTMHHGDGIFSLEIHGGLRFEDISPQVTFKHNVLVLKPSENKISPLSERDVIPPSRPIYELVLTYNFHLNKSTEITPSSSLLSSLLYESEYESQLWTLYDSNKQAIAHGDAYPLKYSVKLDKGDYVLRQHIRHERKELLEKLSDLTILIVQKLPSPINLDVYSSYSQASIGGKKLSFAAIPSGSHIMPIYIAPLHNEKSLKTVSGGQYLLGAVSITKNEMGKKVDQYKFRYILGENSKKSGSSLKPSDKTKWTEYQEALKDLKTSWLGKIDPAMGADKLYKELKEEYPDHLGVHLSMLQSLELETPRPLPGTVNTQDAIENAKKVIQVADAIIENVNQNELLAFLGLKSDQRAEAAVIKGNMEKQKSALVEAFIRKGGALCRLNLNFQDESDTGDATIKQIDELWTNFLRFVDPTDVKVTYFGVWHSAAHGHHGRLLKYALRMSEEKPSKDIDSCMIWALRQIGWDFAAEYYERNFFTRYPAQYKLF